MEDEEVPTSSGVDQLKAEDNLAAEEAEEGYWIVDGKEIKATSSNRDVAEHLEDEDHDRADRLPHL